MAYQLQLQPMLEWDAVIIEGEKNHFISPYAWTSIFDKHDFVPPFFIYLMIAYGSAASRRPSPTKLNANILITTNTPGINIHGAMANTSICCADFKSTPQLSAVGCKSDASLPGTSDQCDLSGKINGSC